jgi:hypothetical protein
MLDTRNTCCIAERASAADYAPDKIRSLGTAGAMAGEFWCATVEVSRDRAR